MVSHAIGLGFGRKEGESGNQIMTGLEQSARPLCVAYPRQAQLIASLLWGTQSQVSPWRFRSRDSVVGMGTWIFNKHPR